MYILVIQFGGKHYELRVRSPQNAAYLMHVFEQGGDISPAQNVQAIVGSNIVKPGQVQVVSVGFDANLLEMEDCANNNNYSRVQHP